MQPGTLGSVSPGRRGKLLKRIWDGVHMLSLDAGEYCETCPSGSVTPPRVFWLNSHRPPACTMRVLITPSVPLTRYVWVPATPSIAASPWPVGTPSSSGGASSRPFSSSHQLSVSNHRAVARLTGLRKSSSVMLLADSGSER
eukprot:4095514-Prymnesium_polylepis.2